MGYIGAGRLNGCNDNIGGLNNLYLFDYVDYRRYLIEVNGSELVNYPATTIFKYELRADGNNLNIDLQEDETGISYNQSLSLALKGYSLERSSVYNLLNKKVGCILELKSGKYQIIGLRNGCFVKSVKGQTGGGRSDFSGYNIEIEAKETDSVFFIDNLSNAGFITEENFLYQNNNAFLYQDNSNFIIQ